MPCLVQAGQMGQVRVLLRRGQSGRIVAELQQRDRQPVEVHDGR
jgi:hypothetical protein